MGDAGSRPQVGLAAAVAVAVGVWVLGTVIVAVLFSFAASALWMLGSPDWGFFGEDPQDPPWWPVASIGLLVLFAGSSAMIGWRAWRWQAARLHGEPPDPSDP
ncbi:MAG: hypothetical protein IPM45_07430 [Acidimicrobiales bacterium]|nr:hypothetical protein [Acidimicrobiales bacterium]